MRTPRNRTALFLGFALLLAAGRARADGEENATLLGLVPVLDVNEDEDGFTVLDGLIAGFEEPGELPAVLDFSVYTLWSGSGEHAVSLELVEPDGKTVLQTVDGELTLNEDASPCLVFDLRGTGFNREGLHWLQVFVDKDLVDEYPFPVGEVDEESMEEPRLLISLPAVEVYENDDGVPVISGLFDYFTFESFPDTDDFIIASVWSRGAFDYEQGTRLLDPAGEVVAERWTEVPAGPGRLEVVTDEFAGFTFREPGIHAVAVSLDGEPFLLFDLPVLQEDGSTADGE